MRLPFRLTALLVHPVQYYAPWFRHIAARYPELDLTVVYATEPTPEQQGVGFGRAFSWDVPLTRGYRCRVVRPPRPEDDLRSSRFRGVDVPEIGEAVLATRPDVALIPGWYSVTLRRAIRACREARIPVLYRGDSNLAAAPAGLHRLPWRARTRYLLSRYDGYLATGLRSREYLLSFGVRHERIFPSPHAVDNAFFAKGAAPFQTAAGRSEARARWGLGPGRFVVLFAGKLEEVKRPLDLVRAVARLGPGASLLIAGSGPLEEECRSAALSLGVEIAWAGFLNQTEIAAAYAAADVLALPSASETWGLVVNEALATGLPCVVSNRVGCAPDLIVPGRTGEVYPAGDVEALSAALDRVWQARTSGIDFAAGCRERVAACSFEAATAGLARACRDAVARRRPAPVAPAGPPHSPRVLALCGGMVIVSGLERMTFEVLRVLRDQGAAVHCIVNSWEYHRILALAEEIGASWSVGAYWAPLQYPRSLADILAMLADVRDTSAGLLRDVRRFRPTCILAPEFKSVLRNAPALLLLRLHGVQIVLRVGNAPERGRFYTWLWRLVLSPLVTRFVPNSAFGARRLLEVGIPERKVLPIQNAVSRRTLLPGTDADVIATVRTRPTLLCVGQIAPFKGTHLAVEAILTLLAKGYDVQGVIVGRIPEWPPEYAEYAEGLQKRAAASGYGDRIHFAGERRNVLEIMRESYLLLAPIVQEETFGNVALEAASAGLPAVVFPSGGLVELVAHGETGWVCREPTLEALLEGLRAFLDHPEKRRQASAASRRWLVRPDSPYDPEIFRRRWWKLVAIDAPPGLDDTGLGRIVQETPGGGPP